MLSLDDMVVRQKELINKGYQIDNITCAALMLVAERLGEVAEQLEVLLKPTITHEPAPMPKIGPLPTVDEDGTVRNASGRALPQPHHEGGVSELEPIEGEDANGND